MRFGRTAVICAAVLLTLSAAKCEGENLIKQVQDKSVEICGFLPVASTAAAILDALATGGGASVVVTAATGICNAVKPKTMALLQTKPTFMGVVIEGDFVEGKK